MENLTKGQLVCHGDVWHYGYDRPKTREEFAKDCVIPYHWFFGVVVGPHSDEDRDSLHVLVKWFGGNETWPSLTVNSPCFLQKLGK